MREEEQEQKRRKKEQQTLISVAISATAGFPASCLDPQRLILVVLYVYYIFSQPSGQLLTC